MNEEMLHPEPERFDAYVEDALSEAESATLQSHLLGCSRCRQQVEELRALFDGFAALERPEPRAGFADRVMTEIDLQPAWSRRLVAALARLLPRSTAAWAWTAALLSLPVLALSGAAAWILSQPGITPQGLLVFGWTRAWAGMQAAANAIGAAVFQNDFVQGFLDTTAQWITVTQPGTLGTAAITFALMTTLSAWILYLNLIHKPKREKNYVLYSI